MPKVLDWNALYKADFDNRRRKITGKQALAKAFEQLKQHEAELKRRQELEPLLRKALLEAMISRKPLKVLRPFHYPTESLGGVQKSEDNDGFYYSAGSPGESSGGKYEEVMEVVPIGEELVFKCYDKQLEQLIFQGSSGQEYAFYPQDQITFQERVIQNPGIQGLLFNTSLYNDLGEK